MRGLLSGLAVGAVMAAAVVLIRRAHRDAGEESEDWATDIYTIELSHAGEVIEMETRFPFVGALWGVGGEE